MVRFVRFLAASLPAFSIYTGEGVFCREAPGERSRSRLGTGRGPPGSTKEQAERGGRDEGFSIPAQREANLRKARELDSIIVEEFVEAGESARKADRPGLLRMIEYVKATPMFVVQTHDERSLSSRLVLCLRAEDESLHVRVEEDVEGFAGAAATTGQSTASRSPILRSAASRRCSA